MLLEIPISLSACTLKQLLSISYAAPLLLGDSAATATVSLSLKVSVEFAKSDKLLAIQ